VLYHTLRRCPYCEASIRADATMCLVCGGASKPARQINTPWLLITGWVFLVFAAGAYMLATKSQTRVQPRSSEAGSELQPPGERDTTTPWWSRLRRSWVVGTAPQSPHTMGRKPTGNAAIDSEPPMPAEVVVDLPLIAGMSPQEVAATLGPRSPNLKSKKSGVGNSPTYSYDGDRIRVSYRAGIADRIVVRRLDELPFTPGVLRALGLSVSWPTVEDESVMRWESLDGFSQVEVFSGPGGGVDSVVAHVSAKPHT
jgi:hypothetical protein